MSASRSSKADPMSDPVIKRGLDFLSTYLQRIGAEIEVSVAFIGPDSSSEDGAQECVYNLQGDISHLRRNPKMIASLTRLTSLAMNKSKRRRYVCQVDLEGQMMARRQLLETIAQDAAAVAQHTHKRAIIEGLSSGERRTVHYYAGQEGDVETMSEGRDDLRYLMVALKT